MPYGVRAEAMAARGEGDELGKGIKATSLANLKAARQVSDSPAAIFAALVCALFGGTADGRTRILC
jgi:hypothetical protein